jgi:hypothetical protein
MTLEPPLTLSSRMTETGRTRNYEVDSNTAVFLVESRFPQTTLSRQLTRQPIEGRLPGHVVNGAHFR